MATFQFELVGPDQLLFSEAVDKETRIQPRTANSAFKGHVEVSFW
jgi:hypothetical protein